VIAGKPSVIAEERGKEPAEAFTAAMNAAADALRHALEREQGKRTRKQFSAKRGRAADAGTEAEPILPEVAEALAAAQPTTRRAPKPQQKRATRAKRPQKRERAAG
jgi:hypothetical protein